MVLWKCCQCTYGYISQREICALCGHDLCESCPRRTYNGHLEELPDRLPQPAKGRGVFQVKAVFEEGQSGDSHISDSEAAEGATKFDKLDKWGLQKEVSDGEQLHGYREYCTTRNWSNLWLPFHVHEVLWTSTSWRVHIEAEDWMTGSMNSSCNAL